MICCCSLAGTSACKTCSRMAEYEYFSTPYEVVAVPYTNRYISIDDEKILQLEEAVKRLNERIDELSNILGDKNEKD